MCFHAQRLPKDKSPIWGGRSRADYQATTMKNSILPQNFTLNEQKNSKRKEKKEGKWQAHVFILLITTFIAARRP
jgi:hypothetical protein